MTIIYLRIDVKINPFNMLVELELPKKRRTRLSHFLKVTSM